ncbi:MAG: SPOR domain-containing protein, partial [Betaproteobacteria bacterium]
MTRRLIILLLLAHVAVAFWAFGPEHVQTAMWGTPGPSQREPERWAQQRRPEAIVVVTPGSPLAPSQAPAAPVSASEAASAPTAAPAAAPAPAPAAPAP